MHSGLSRTGRKGEELLKRYVKNQRMPDHSYASEAVLRAISLKA